MFAIKNSNLELKLKLKLELKISSDRNSKKMKIFKFKLLISAIENRMKLWSKYRWSNNSYCKELSYKILSRSANSYSISPNTKIYRKSKQIKNSIKMKISKRLTRSQPSGSEKEIVKNQVRIHLPIKLTSFLLD
jgi:hypothetical protein